MNKCFSDIDDCIFEYEVPKTKLLIWFLPVFLGMVRRCVLSSFSFRPFELKKSEIVQKLFDIWFERFSWFEPEVEYVVSLAKQQMFPQESQLRVNGGQLSILGNEQVSLCHYELPQAIRSWLEYRE